MEEVKVVKSDTFQTKIMVSRARPTSPYEPNEDCAADSPGFDEQTPGRDTHTDIDRRAKPDREKFLQLRRTLLYATASTFFFATFLTILAVGIAKDLFRVVPPAVVNGGGGNTAVVPSAWNNNRTRSEEEEHAERVREYLITVTADGAAAYNDPVSPESRALAWMQHDDPLRLDPNATENHYRIRQRFALLTLWFQADYEWFGENNWLSEEDECRWEGILCTAADLPPETSERSLGEVRRRRKRRDRNLAGGDDEVVSKIYLARNNLQGSLPPSLHLLKYLTSLNLSGNRIGGGIPDSFGSMVWLEELHLHDNLLSQELTLDFSEMSSLTDVNLSNNRLKGTIPDSLCSATSMTRIQLDRNRLTGRIPDSMEKCVNLGKRIIMWVFEFHSTTFESKRNEPRAERFSRFSRAQSHRHILRR